MEVKLTAIDVLCDKTQPIHSSERVLQSQQKGVVRPLKHPFFSHCVLHFIFLDDHFLLEDFHCIQLVCCLLTAQNHFPKRTFAQNFEELKVFECLN